MARMDLIKARVELIGGFRRYVQVHDQQVPFTGEQLAAHRICIALRRQAGSVRTAINDDQFVEALRRTLLAWQIGRRASHLVSEGDFAAALHTAVPHLEALEPLTIDAPDLPTDIADRLWSVIESLGVVENKAKLVAGPRRCITCCPISSHRWTAPGLAHSSISICPNGRLWAASTRSSASPTTSSSPSPDECSRSST